MVKVLGESISWVIILLYSSGITKTKSSSIWPFHLGDREICNKPYYWDNCNKLYYWENFNKWYFKGNFNKLYYWGFHKLYYGENFNKWYMKRIFCLWKEIWVILWSITCSQIWLNPRLDDYESTYLTNL